MLIKVEVYKSSIGLVVETKFVIRNCVCDHMEEKAYIFVFEFIKNNSQSPKIMQLLCTNTKMTRKQACFWLYEGVTFSRIFVRKIWSTIAFNILYFSYGNRYNLVEIHMACYYIGFLEGLNLKEIWVISYKP